MRYSRDSSCLHLDCSAGTRKNQNFFCTCNVGNGRVLSSGCLACLSNLDQKLNQECGVRARKIRRRWTSHQQLVEKFQQYLTTRKSTLRANPSNEQDILRIQWRAVYMKDAKKFLLAQLAIWQVLLTRTDDQELENFDDTKSLQNDQTWKQPLSGSIGRKSQGTKSYQKTSKLWGKKFYGKLNIVKRKPGEIWTDPNVCHCHWWENKISQKICLQKLKTWQQTDLSQFFYCSSSNLKLVGDAGTYLPNIESFDRSHQSTTANEIVNVLCTNVTEQTIGKLSESIFRMLLTLYQRSVFKKPIAFEACQRGNLKVLIIKMKRVVKASHPSSQAPTQSAWQSTLSRDSNVKKPEMQTREQYLLLISKTFVLEPIPSRRKTPLHLKKKTFRKHLATLGQFER